MIWHLVGRVGDIDRVRQIPIRENPFTIGRRKDVTLSVPNGTVSGIHARIVEANGSLQLEDLQSTNGTFVNGVRLSRPAHLRPNDILQLGDLTLRVQCHDSEPAEGTMMKDVESAAESLVQFDKLITERSMTPHFQPIVDLQINDHVGLEVLARSQLPGLETPHAMFHAAEQLDRERELSEMLRWKGMELFLDNPTPCHLFLNTHPHERYSDLTDSMARLRRACGDRELTLELHEGAILNLRELREFHASLRDLDITLAFDDFGAGQARLRELAESPPDYLKFDMSVIRGIDSASREKQRMVATLVHVARDLGAIPLAEGVETDGEEEACRGLGFQLAQGFLFGRPQPFVSGDSDLIRAGLTSTDFIHRPTVRS